MAAILLVEDNVMLRTSLAAALRLRGFDVLEASDGAAALQMLAHATPDLVITDLNMPAVSGQGLASTLSTYPRFAQIPVLLISGDPSQPVPPSYTFLAKPFTLDTFLTAVNKLFQEARL